MGNGMPKLPSLQWYPGDWLKDPAVNMLSAAPRGVWFDWLNAMHELDQCGQVSGTVSQLARIGRCTLDEVEQTLLELATTKAGIVERDCHGVVTVTNRRMRRIYLSRVNANNRKRKERGQPPIPVPDTDPDEVVSRVCHEDVTSPSSSSSSSSPTPKPPSVSDALRWAGMGGGIGKCAEIKGLTPVTVVREALAAKAKDKGAGHLYKHLLNGFKSPRMIGPEPLYELAKKGLINSVCGERVNTISNNLAYSNHWIVVGEVQIGEERLSCDQIEVCLDRKIDEF